MAKPVSVEKVKRVTEVMKLIDYVYTADSVVYRNVELALQKLSIDQLESLRVMIFTGTERMG